MRYATDARGRFTVLLDTAQREPVVIRRRSQDVAALFGLLRLAVFALLLLNGGLPRLLADDINWGGTVSGMRVGVALGQGSGGQELRVVFANMAPTEQSLVIATYGRGFGYYFNIRAQGGPDGKEHEISNWVDAGLGHIVPIGLIIPYVVAVPPGRMYELNLPLKLLLQMARGGDIGLESMLRQGYTVRVSYHIPLDHFSRGIQQQHPDLWIGEIDSGEVGLPPDRR